MVKIKWRSALIVQTVIIVALFLLLAWFIGKQIEAIEWKAVWKAVGKWTLIIAIGATVLYILYAFVTKASWRSTARNHWWTIGKVLGILMAVGLVIWLAIYTKDSLEERGLRKMMRETAKHEAHKAHCSRNPLDDRCYTEPVIITATSYGSKVIHTPLGRRIEWSPTTHASYAVWYKMGRDTATVEFPKDKVHQELPFPLDSMKFISREATPVTIVLRLK